MAQRVWFLEKNWVIMSLIAAGFAALIFLCSSVVAACRIHRKAALVLVLAIPIYAFVSCLVFALILSSSVHYAYEYSQVDPSGLIMYWGFGFGALYVILNIIGATVIK
jgi:hypothetical protein